MQRDSSGAPIGLIDCQSHLFSPAMLQAMESRMSDPVVFTKDGTRFLRMGDWLRKVPPMYLDVEAKLATMDDAGIERTAISINDPGPEWFGNQGLEMAQLANDFIAGLVRQHPQRFFGMCVLPWQDVKGALKELDRCAQELGMKGLLVYTNFAGHFPDEAPYRPIFARAADLGLPAFLHPAKPVTTEIVKDYEMTSSLGNMFENTIAFTRIIMSGMLDELPHLKLVCPHLGGTLPYFIGRIDHQISVLKRGPRYLTKLPSEYVKQVWLDIVSPLPEAMRFAYEFSGPQRLLFSSDHPWVEPKLIRDCLLSLKLPAADEERILRTNAIELFNLS